MTKTLVIHPKDRSTHFLDIVYKDIEDLTLVTGGVTQDKLRQLIADHDRVMMMGHGCPSGLFSVGQFEHVGCIIDRTFVPVLAEKDNSVFIWCNADKFVEKHNLQGFYSGMFISEVFEANYCGFPDATFEDVQESNIGFCNILADAIKRPHKDIHGHVLEKYGAIAETNKVAEYNHQRLYATG
jgi:hypothetical protein